MRERLAQSHTGGHPAFTASFGVTDSTSRHGARASAPARRRCAVCGEGERPRPCRHQRCRRRSRRASHRARRRRHVASRASWRRRSAPQRIRDPLDTGEAQPDVRLSPAPHASAGWCVWLVGGDRASARVGEDGLLAAAAGVDVVVVEMLVVAAAEQDEVVELRRAAPLVRRARGALRVRGWRCSRGTGSGRLSACTSARICG